MKSLEALAHEAGMLVSDAQICCNEYCETHATEKLARFAELIRADALLDAAMSQPVVGGPVVVCMPLQLTPEMIRAVHTDPLTKVSPEEWHTRLGWLICAYDVLLATRKIRP